MPRKRQRNRRSSLKLLAAASSSYGILSHSLNPETNNKDQFFDQATEEEIKQSDAVIDAIYIEGEHFSENNKRYIETLFSENNQDVLWADRKRKLSRDTFYDEYGPDAEKILDEKNSVHSNFEEINSEKFTQAIFVPGIRSGEHQGRILSYNSCSSSQYVQGTAGPCNNPNRFLVSTNDLNNHESLWLVLHEYGHTLGLPHQNSNQTAMNPQPNTEANLDFTEIEWELIDETLSKG